jgi:hypothetical protein
MKGCSDEKKQQLEQRILAILAEVIERCNQRSQFNQYFDSRGFAWTAISDLYASAHGDEFGHAGVFNSVLRELVKAGLVMPHSVNKQLVSLGGKQGETLREQLLQRMQ